MQCAFLRNVALNLDFLFLTGRTFESSSLDWILEHLKIVNLQKVDVDLHHHLSAGLKYVLQ